MRTDSYEKDPSTICMDCSNIVFIKQKPVGIKTMTCKAIYAELISRIKKKKQHSKILKESYIPLQVTQLIWTGK